MGNHMQYGVTVITQCHLPPGSGNFAVFNLAEADARFNDPRAMQG